MTNCESEPKDWLTETREIKQKISAKFADKPLLEHIRFMHNKGKQIYAEAQARKQHKSRAS